LARLKFQLDLVTRSTQRPVTIEVNRVVCAGYTGRNTRAVMEHVHELEKIGVAAPKRIPTSYIVPPELLTSENHVRVNGPRTSGEVEYVIFLDQEWYVTIGSDHTDRQVETQDIQKSKEMCPKIVAREAWQYEEIKNHWDQLMIRSTVTERGQTALYQEGTTATILSPDNLRERLQLKPGDALFSGTVPLKTREPRYGEKYTIEIEDPVMARKITHEYSVAMN